MNSIITRFPPSPSGYLHIGGARTALFNWLYARHMKGKFILRIEDTDAKRSTRASIDAILEALEWLEIDWDEGPFFQSKRIDLYKEHVQKLLRNGNAYVCTCPPEKIEEMRRAAREKGENPKYDGTCREKGLEPAGSHVIRFKAPFEGETVIKDVIKGDIRFQNSELDDFIIQRSDGTPVYNIAVVVDDITMGVNTVIRGDDHVSNTPKQILLYRAFDTPLPTYGHVPMVLGPDRTRLSKRHGAMSVTAYRDMGYLPDAFINYIVRLGWSHGDQEFFTRDELIEKFSLENIGRSAGIFNPEKLLALNGDHIQSAPPEKTGKHLIPFLNEKKISAENGPFLHKVITTLNKRSKTLVEMADKAGFYFADTITYDENAARKFLDDTALDILPPLIEGLSDLDSLSEKKQEAVFKKILESTGLKFGKIAQPVRVALTGTTVSPGIFEVIEVLGKEKVIQRLRQAVDYIQKK